MSTPCLEVDLGGVEHNARVLVDRLGERGIAVTGVTKAALGNPDVARALVRAGIRTLGDSRIENVEAMRSAGVGASMTLIRSPMLSQVHRVVGQVDTSCNTEQDVIAALSAAAFDRGLVHDVILMVELGDLREGIMPEDLEGFVAVMVRRPNVTLVGLGANLACRNGVVPDDRNMGELTRLVVAIESRFDLPMRVVSGGNSATVDWALTAHSVGRVNDLHLGESILLGREPLHRRPIDGLRTDAFTVVAEVIESKLKPGQPWGEVAQAAFGVPTTRSVDGMVAQSILALGEQDVDPSGLRAPEGVELLGASSDHLVVSTDQVLPIGALLRFEPNYSALLRATTSPFVSVTPATASAQSRTARPLAPTAEPATGRRGRSPS